MTVPKTWDKVPLNNFIQFLEYRDEKPEGLKERIELIKKKSCAILGCGWDEVNKLTGPEQDKLSKLMGKKLPKRLMLSFKHQGQRYRFHIESKKRPNAHAILEKIHEIDTEGFNGGKYTAFKNVQKRQVKDGNFEVYGKYTHQLLFLSCEPRKFGFRKKFPFIGWNTKRFKSSEVKDKIESFKSLPLEVAYPMCSFFLAVSEALKDPMLDFLNLEIQNQIRELSQIQMDLENDTDG